MSPARSPAEVLGSVEGWEGADISELPGGLTNQIWLASAGGRRAILKIDDEVRGEPYNSRPAEALIQSTAAARGLAGSVLYYDDLAIMTEFVEGTVWEPADLERDDNIERVAATLRRLHGLPLTGRSFDSVVAAGRYLATIENPNEKLIAHCRDVIESMPQPHNLCCCHNDLVAANIITSPGMVFLDWEYARDNDPLFDLATIVEHHQLSEEIAFRLLDAYFDGAGRRWRKRLLEQQELYLALYWMWAASHGYAQADLERIAVRIRC